MFLREYAQPVHFGVIMNAIKSCRSLVFAGVFILTTVRCYAQSYEIIPNDSIVVSGWLEENYSLMIEQYNRSGDTLDLLWERIDHIVPESWEASVCDNSFCYTSLVEGGRMTPVAPGESGKLIIKMTPHVNEGTAVIRYAVWSGASPNNRDTLTFFLSAQKYTSSVSEKPLGFQCSYNSHTQTVDVELPSSRFFSVELYDLLGRMVCSSLEGGTIVHLPMANTPRGVYCVLIQADGNTIAQIVMKQ